jgi:tRNA pseudouridine38-40 synthase
MGQRLKLVVAYDGAPFAGWQSQTHGNTVQDLLERAFRRVDGTRVRVHAAGRTDAGVHALAQCVHADVTNDRLPPVRWIAALNANLPPQVRVLRCRRLTKDFHARYSAVGKVYRYRIWTGPVLPPLEHDRVWHLPAELNLLAMRRASASFIGRHDFAGFAANRGQPDSNTVRTIHSVTVRRHGFAWTIEFAGDGFLYKMVRLMVGAIIECATGKIEPAEVMARLRRRQRSGTRLAAPAAGLYLIRVRY